MGLKAPHMIYGRHNRAAIIPCVGTLSPPFIYNLPFWIKILELQTTARRCRSEDLIQFQALAVLQTARAPAPLHRAAIVSNTLSTFGHPDNIKSDLKNKNYVAPKSQLTHWWMHSLYFVLP